MQEDSVIGFKFILPFCFQQAPSLNTKHIFDFGIKPSFITADFRDTAV